MKQKTGFLQWFKNQKLGKKILYTLTLPAGAEELTFTAQADGWTNEDPQPSPIEPNK